MDNICYTIISGPYDTLKTPKTISKGWRYICFTDQNIINNIWEIHPIPEELKDLSPVKRQRCLKTQPHRFLPDHEWSVYVDGNIRIKVGMWKLVNEICEKKDFSVPQHFQRNCIYDERVKCIQLKKDNGVESEAQIKRYKKEGFPQHYGLNETNLLIRHNVDWVRELDDMWWNEIKNGSHRDQLSFNYCLWKTGNRVHSLPKLIVRKSEYFEIDSKHTGRGNKNRVNLVIVHFNTPELTTALYMSICKFTPNSVVYMFDNSTVRPFPHEKFPLIHYIDNTKGQVIDFDKWLENYPDRFKSTEGTKCWGSAKHTYTIQWCMDNLPVDDFILLDSDILFKKDVSDLNNKKFVYVGGVIRQPKSTIDRVAPFVCYINSSLCKKHGVHFFDENYMHGLCCTKKNKFADRYDTGAGFYINSLKYPHNKINWEDYAVHFKAGSWLTESNTRYNQNKVAAEWLEKNKNLWM